MLNKFLFWVAIELRFCRETVTLKKDNHVLLKRATCEQFCDAVFTSLRHRDAWLLPSALERCVLAFHHHVTAHHHVQLQHGSYIISLPSCNSLTDRPNFDAHSISQLLLLLTCVFPINSHSPIAIELFYSIDRSIYLSINQLINQSINHSFIVFIIIHTLAHYQCPFSQNACICFQLECNYK